MFALSFKVIVGFVAMNLFVAVVLGGLQVIEGDSLFDSIDPEILTAFTQLWLKYDKDETGFISMVDLLRLACDEDNPFYYFNATNSNHKSAIDQSVFAFSLVRGE